MYSLRRVNGMQPFNSIHVEPQDVIQYEYNGGNYNAVVGFITASGWSTHHGSYGGRQTPIEMYAPGDEKNIIRIFPGDFVVRHRSQHQASTRDMATYQTLVATGYTGSFDQWLKEQTASTGSLFTLFNELDGVLTEALQEADDAGMKNAQQYDAEALEKVKSELTLKMAQLIAKLHE